MGILPANHAFEGQSLETIIAHARRLEGKTLAEIAEALSRPELLNLAGKGAAGQLLHTWFGLSQNDSRAEPDLNGLILHDGRTAGAEIKAVPLIAKRRGLGVKERCKVTSINYDDLLSETWSISRARHKLLVVVFIYYRYTDAKNWPESKVDKIISWVLEGSLAEHTIRNDWQRTWDYVNEGRAHEISEGHALILGACTSGAGHEAKHVPQPKNPDIMARKRAFALKPAFLQTAYDYASQPNRYESITTLTGRALGGNLQTEILTGLNKHIGKTMGQIADILNIPRKAAKHSSALLLRRALGVVADDKRLLELESAGVKPKTIPVRVCDLRPFEAMSFPVMKLAEFAEEDWENSEFRANLDCLLMIPTAGEQKGEDPWMRILGKPFFWTPAGEDEEGIAKEWHMFQQEVRDGKAAYQRINGRRVSQLTPGSRTKYIHLRPKGPDASVDDVDLHGNPTQQLCFWLNQSFVQSLLQKYKGASQRQGVSAYKHIATRARA